MDIFSAFRNAATTASPMNPGQPGTQAPAGAAGNPTAPNGSTVVPVAGGPGAIPAVPAVADADKSPLAGYEKLWEPVVADPKNPTQPIVPSFNIDPKAFAEAVGKMDFASVVSAELMDKALKGDAAAMNEAMNAVAREGFSRSTQATSKMVESAVTRTVENMMKTTLPEMMKKHSIATHVAAENPILDNPAIAPIASALREQVIAKHPNASATEINTQVRGYLAGFAKIIADAGVGATAAPDTTTISSKVGGKTDDWEDYFGAK